MQDSTSIACSKLGEFLCCVHDLASAAYFQQIAIGIDRSLYNNMSERVAESSKALAITRQKEGKNEEVLRM